MDSSIVVQSHINITKTNHEKTIHIITHIINFQNISIQLGLDGTLFSIFYLFSFKSLILFIILFKLSLVLLMYDII